MATAQPTGTGPNSYDADLMALGKDDALRGEDTPDQGMAEGRDPVEAFQMVDDLVVRAEPLAISRLHQDRHWTHVKLGRTTSQLEKVEGTSQYKQSFPPGSEHQRMSAVPNKQADLANKLTETLLVDMPKPDPEAADDSEKAERGARMLREYLTQTGTEAGTNDADLFWWMVEGATSRATTYAHYWSDPEGGGSVAKQIKAHPLAQDPANPLDGVDPATGQPVPTTDYILRYVTEDGQFTNNPSDAARQWLPATKIERWGREHIRTFPEDKEFRDCTVVVGLFYCTWGEAKRRWKDLDDEQAAVLCDWQPRRYLALLPPALRARWMKDSKGTDKKGTVHDQRLLFYYAYYEKASEAHPNGVAFCITGANGGTMLHEDTLSCTVEVPSETQQDESVTDTRQLDIPITPLRLLQDTDERDPTGKAFLSRVGGVGDASAQLVGAYLEAMDIILHPARFATSTSPLDHDVVEESRGTGQFATVLSADDFPKYEEQRPLPPNFWGSIEWLYEQADSAAGLNKPAQGSDQSQEVSGVARKIAVNQSLVAVSRMQDAVHQAWERHWRIKAQFAMRYATVPELLRYVGEDGASKQEWFTGNDFAMCGGIRVLRGSGTMMPPQEKVNYVAQLRQLGFLGLDESNEAARPAFTTALGVQDNVHQQRIERQVSSWLEGPPKDWIPQYQAYAQAKQAYDAQQAQMQQQQAQAQQQAQVQQQQQQVAQQQQAEQAAAQQQQQIEAAKAQQALDIEAAKGEQTLRVEREKHALAMQAKQQDAELSERAATSKAAATAPAPTPEIIVEPPDLSMIGKALDGIQDVLVALAQKDQTPPPQHPPVIHVHPANAPDVRVEAPVVNIAPAETEVNVASPKKGKRKGKITKGADGSYAIETDDA